MWMWSTGINRNIVECKAECGAPRPVEDSWVLIETLWNVKLSSPPRYSVIVLVLIETLWNVKNIANKSGHRGIPRINRNIVECKVYYVSVFRDPAHSINRNIVECKGII